MEQKLRKKKSKYESILKNDLNIDLSQSPTTVSYIFLKLK